MEIIEKVKEVEKEPTKEYASKGVAGTGLGIAGTALGLLALNRGGFGLFGNGWGNRGIMPQTVTHADVYVAINAQYHDYCELFKSWFGDGVEQKIIESAVIFWFKED